MVADNNSLNIQSANALPSEHIIMFSHEQCSDDWFRGDNTCGRYMDKSGREVFDSQVRT